MPIQPKQRAPFQFADDAGQNVPAVPDKELNVFGAIRLRGCGFASFRIDLNRKDFVEVGRNPETGSSLVPVSTKF
jgi:hypothetical protein